MRRKPNQDDPAYGDYRFKLVTSPRWARKLERGRALCRAGRHAEALRFLSGMGEYYQPGLYRLLADCYGAIGSTEKAMECLWMSGAWTPEELPALEAWLPWARRDGDEAFLKHLPECFRHQYARHLYPEALAAWVRQSGLDLKLLEPPSDGPARHRPEPWWRRLVRFLRRR